MKKRKKTKKKNKGKEILTETFNPKTFSFSAKDKITALLFLIYHFVYRNVSV